MFIKFNVAFVTLALLTAVENASARYQWLERDDRPLKITGRRFGQEHPAVIDKLSSACPGEVCGNLAGQAITPLLAAQPECSQQDMADSIIGMCNGSPRASIALMTILFAYQMLPSSLTTRPNQP